MRELHRPSLPVARLLVVALGFLGFMAGPAGSGTQGGAAATGAVTGVRTWVAEHTSTRSRTSAKPRPGVQAQTVTTVAARQAIASAVPDTHPAPATFPAPGIDVRPPSARVVRLPAAALTTPGVVLKGVPRGRAPPAPTRI
ncbi:hypothetical protein [Spirillospora sp. NPDC048824]|uniref:hypothetical protein n=1 Tax=Spirillospora sp. NPDC048824 TaxID=3364526 RepID=UPI00371A8951